MECKAALEAMDAYLDGELPPAEAHTVEAHIAGCAACRAAYDGARRLSATIRAGAARHTAPDALARRIGAAVASRPKPRRTFQPLAMAASFLLVAALSAGLTVQLTRPDQAARAADDAVSGHLRSLMAEHLTDVASSDRHTVKPWFAGRLDSAPPVIDLTADDFPLVGGRLDYLDGKPAAALVYRHRQHILNLFIRPADTEGDVSPRLVNKRGFSILSWQEGGMAFWAVSDLNAADLEAFQAKLAPRIKAEAHP